MINIVVIEESLFHKVTVLRKRFIEWNFLLMKRIGMSQPRVRRMAGSSCEGLNGWN